MHILDCLHDGLSEIEIIQKCDGDGQIVKIWLNFLKYHKWITKDEIHDTWILTNKGAEQMIHYYKIW